MLDLRLENITAVLANSYFEWSDMDYSDYYDQTCTTAAEEFKSMIDSYGCRVTFDGLQNIITLNKLDMKECPETKKAYELLAAAALLAGHNVTKTEMITAMSRAGIIQENVKKYSQVKKEYIHAAFILFIFRSRTAALKFLESCYNSETCCYIGSGAAGREKAIREKELRLLTQARRDREIKALAEAA